MRKVCRERKEFLNTLVLHFKNDSYAELLKLHEELITKCRGLILIAQKYYNGHECHDAFMLSYKDFIGVCSKKEIRCQCFVGINGDECKVFLDDKWVNIPIERKIKCTLKK